MAACRLSTGIWLVTIVECRPCRSSCTSSRSRRAESGSGQLPDDGNVTSSGERQLCDHALISRCALPAADAAQKRIHRAVTVSTQHGSRTPDIPRQLIAGLVGTLRQRQRVVVDCGSVRAGDVSGNDPEGIVRVSFHGASGRT